ncbi:MAG: NAD(P)-binding domain-containing protein [Candidatus Harrisonbacteria bacterium]|nr:NAD(P)-binding domain-containing protein [Candidatus Harrisonbacteria bacterium]
MNQKPVILIAARGFWNERGLANQEVFQDRFELIRTDDFKLSVDMAERVIALVLGDKECGDEVMRLFPNLKTIARNGTGYNNVDLAAARLKGIRVTRVSGLNAKPVSEFVLGLILALSRNIVPMHSNMLGGIWQKSRGKSLSEMTVGIVGVGSIGRLLAEKLHALGVGNLIGWNQSRRPEVLEIADKYGLKLVELPQVMSASDAVVVSVLLTPETTNLIGKNLLSLMRPDAFLVNISRGAVVDEEVLAELVMAKKIGGAALDVFSSEPPFDQLFMKKLIEYGKNGGNIILSPHSASLTKSTEQEIVLKVTRNVVNVLEGNLEGVEIL